MQSNVTTTDYRRERREQAEAIIKKLKASADTVLTKFPVVLVYLHGSVARGTPLPTSDIDLALVFNEPLPQANDRLKLELQIQAAVEEACNVNNVDARMINNAPLLALGEILQEGICLYARDPSQRADFESLVRRKYFDYLPVAQQMQRAFLHQVRQKGLRRG